MDKSKTTAAAMVLDKSFAQYSETESHIENEHEARRKVEE